MWKKRKTRLIKLLSVFLAILLVFANMSSFSMTLAETGEEMTEEKGKLIDEQQESFYNVSVHFVDGENGTVSVNGQIYDSENSPIQVKKGENIPVAITPNEGYEIISVVINGEDQQIETGNYFETTIENILSDIVINVHFALKSYTITFHVDGKGTLSDEEGELIQSEEGTIRQVNHGEKYSFIAKPAMGFSLHSIHIDEVEVDLENNENITKVGEGYQYTFEQMTSNHMVKVTFVPEHIISIEEPENGKVFVDKNIVKHGEDVRLIMIPDLDFKVKSVILNNVEISVEENQDKFEEDGDGKVIYTITNITEDITIRVIFEEIGSLDGTWKQFISFSRETLVPAYLKEGKEIYLFSNENLKLRPNEPYNQVKINEGSWQREYSLNQSMVINQIRVRNSIFHQYQIPLENEKYILIDNEAPTVGEPSIKEEWHKRGFSITGKIHNQMQTFQGISFASDIEGVYYHPGTFNLDDGMQADYNPDSGEYSFTIPNEEYNGIYFVWAIDQAGNVSDPLEIDVKIDKTAPTLIEGEGAVTFKQENKGTIAKLLNFLTFGTFFNKQIKIQVHAEDTGSGVKKIELETNDDNVVPALISESFHSNGKKASAEFILDVDEFEGSFRVKLTDEVGNERIVPVTKENSNIEADNSGVIIVEKNDPYANISVIPEDGNSHMNYEFNSDVTFHFTAKDEESGVNTVVIKVNGEEITTKHYHEKEEKQVEPAIPSINTADFSANDDGSYHVLLEVIDNAGNIRTTEVTTYKDTISPIVENLIFSTSNDEQELTSENFHNFIELENFGYYFKEDITITIRAIDGSEPGQHTSGVQSILAYLKDVNGTYYSVLKNGELKVIKESDIEHMDPIETDGEFSFVAPKNFKGQIFVKAIDKVGNESEFVTPDGTIIETPEQHSKEEHISIIIPETTFFDKNQLNLYRDDVPINLKIVDTYSGIKEVEWFVDAPHDIENNQFGKVIINNDGEISENSDKEGWKIIRMDHNLVTEMTKTLTVTNNSNDIVVKVKMIDRAGNTSEQEVKFSIDKTEPIINVQFDNNLADPIYTTLYNNDRTATIVIKERNFEPKDVELYITSTDGDIPKLSEWKTVTDQNNPDESIHTATIHFHEDSDYTLHLNYKDLAGNAAPDIPIETFTIDKTAPKVKVSYDNHSPINGKFYNSERTATIEINERHFDPNRVQIIGIATSDGEKESYIDFPPLSEWKSNGNIHTATIHYSQDAHYKFDIEIMDMAGNKSSDYEEEEFVIDQTVPMLDLDDGDAVTFEQTNNHFFARVLNFLTFGTFFNKEIKIKVKTKDSTSGIEGIEILTDDKDVVPKLIEGSFIREGRKGHADFILNTEEYRGSVKVKIKDLASNETTLLVTKENSNIEADNNGIIMIEKEPPRAEITVIPHNGTSFNGQNQYNGDVTYQISVEDTDSGVNTVIVDVNGTKFEYDYSNEKEKVTKPQPYHFSTNHPDITINEDGSYIVSVYVIDNAGNTFEKELVTYKDTTPPHITDITFSVYENESYEIVDKAKELNETLELREYGYFFKKPVRITMLVDDPEIPYDFTSGVQFISIYLKDYDSEKYYAVLKNHSLKEITQSEIEEIEPIETTGEFYLDVPKNFKGQIFANVIDRVQNKSGYQTPNGQIIEMPEHHAKEEHIILTVEPTEQKDLNNLHLYNKNVDVQLTVIDTYSGISEIEWSVSAPYDRKNNQSGKLKINNDKTYAPGSDFEGWKQTKTDHNLVMEMKKTITVKNNSNDIVVKVKMKDRAGNSSEEQIKFSIDKTAPTIEYFYDNNISDSENTTYYNRNRTATIVIKERNFNPEDVQVLLSNSDGKIPILKGWETVSDLENPDQTTHIATINYTEDGDYTFDIRYTDLAGNNAPLVQGDSFTIDKTNPIVQVVYDNNIAINGKYFNSDRTATITVIEHNFDPNRVRIIGTVEDNGHLLDFPNLTTWSSDGDIHTAKIHFSADGVYTFDIEFTDMAGNEIEDYTPDQFIIDKTPPNLVITGVKDRSANSGDVIPIISYSDTNFDENGVSIELMGANRGTVALEGIFTNMQNGQVFTFNNFPKEKKYDDLYTLTVLVTDLAGNNASETITFSVNRFGSVYVFDESLRNLNGKFVQEEIDVILKEINVDRLNKETINVKITKDGIPKDLKEGLDYTVTESSEDGQWSEYTYIIKRKNFSNDGRYTVAIYSEDAAGNVNENIDDAKKAEISFGVDKTDPVIIPINIENGKQYAMDEKPVTISIMDNLVLDNISIYLNDEEIGYHKDGDNYSFTILSKNAPQDVRVVAVDAAGNKVVNEIKNVLVSTNFFVRMYNNPPLFVGSLFGMGVIFSGIASYFVINRRRKIGRNKENMEEMYEER